MSGIAPDQLPSNYEVVTAIDNEIHRLDKAEKNPSLNFKGERIIEDVKRVLEDEKILVEQKNSGEGIQRLAAESYYLALDFAHDPRFQSFFENWGSILASAAGSGDWNQITKSVGTLAHDLRNTESFISLLVELQNTIKLLIAQKVDEATTSAEKTVKKVAGGVEDAAKFSKNQGIIEKDTKHQANDLAEGAKSTTGDIADSVRSTVHSATGVSESGDALSDKKYAHKKDKQRKKLLRRLHRTMNSLAGNPTWQMMLSKGKQSAGSVKSGVIEPGKDLLSEVAENKHAQQIAEDFQSTLQTIVGANVSVDPFFTHTKAVINFIQDGKYYELLADIQKQLSAIADNPEMMDDEYTKANLQSLWTKLETRLEELQNNKDLVAARTESTKIMAAVMNDPAAAKLIADMKTLVNHLSSLKPHELLDTEVISEMRGLLVPLILAHFKDVPVPPVHDVQDTALGKFEYNLHNIHLSAKSLVPENVHVKFSYELDAHTRTLTANRQHLVATLKAADIPIHMKDIEWNYKRLTSPHLADAGLVSLDTQGHGISIVLKMEFQSFNDVHVNKTTGQEIHNKNAFRILDAQCHIDRWTVHFKDSKHDKLYEMMSGLFAQRIKKQVEDMVVSKMENFGQEFNQKIYRLYNEARIKKDEAVYNALHSKSKFAQGWINATGSAVELGAGINAPLGNLKAAAMDQAKHLVVIGAKRLMESDVSLGDVVGDAIDTGREKMAEFLGTASEVKEKVEKKAGEVADKAGDKVDELKKDGKKALDDASDKAGEVVDKAGRKAEDVKDKAEKKANEFEDKSDYHKVPVGSRDYAPVPATTFVSTEHESHLGDVSNKAKYPISVMEPSLMKKEEEKK